MAAAVLLDYGEEGKRYRRDVGGPVVVSARVGVVGVVLHGDGGSVLQRGCRSSGRRLRLSLGAKKCQRDAQGLGQCPGEEEQGRGSLTDGRTERRGSSVR